MYGVKNASDLERVLLTTTKRPSGMYGDTVGGKSFSDERSELLLREERRVRPTLARGWQRVWSSVTCWTLVDIHPETPAEIAEHRTMEAS